MLAGRPGAWIVWGAVIFFLVNLFALVATVVLNSLSTQWFGTWLPDGLTTAWYSTAWRELNLLDVLVVTVQVTLAVVVLSVVIGVPCAYALARRNFPGTRLLTVLFLLPVLMPPMTHGIPDVRRVDGRGVHPGARAAADSRHACRVDPGAGAHGRHVRADLPHRREP